jgi:hypothetical protein
MPVGTKKASRIFRTVKALAGAAARSLYTVKIMSRPGLVGGAVYAPSVSPIVEDPSVIIETYVSSVSATVEYPDGAIEAYAPSVGATLGV